MWFHSLFDALLARSSRTPIRQRQHAPRVRRCFRPRLEILEDRTLLSTYTVNALTDTGTGSGLTGDLRYCVTNATSGNDTITFAQGLSGTINLQSALPDLNASVAIQGPGANLLTVSGATFGVGSAADVQISGLTLSHADTAIVNNGTATVSDCTLFANGGYPGDSIGGAIFNYGNLTVNNSTISGNSVQGLAAYLTSATDPLANPAGNGMGGGIYMGGGTLTINSSTIANNEAIGGSSYDFSSPTKASLGAGYGLGGGLYIAGGTVSIDNSTIADNGAGGGEYNGIGREVDYSGGGGIYNAAGPGALRMYDTILANNYAAGGPDLNGGVTSLGHNLFGDTSDGSGFATSDLLNVNPQLGPLQNNGGPTQTMALLAGSPAINAGDNTSAPAYDQRGPGFARIVNGIIDIGAFEVQNGNTNQASSLAVSGFPSVITAGGPGSFTVTAKYADGTIDTGYTGTVHFTSSDGQAALPADYTFTAADAGVHTFSATLKTAGTQSLTATDTTFASVTGSESGITVNPAAASSLTLSGFPSPTTAGAAGNFTVTLKDSYGNIASGYSGAVHFSSSDAKAALPANYTFTAADAGVHTFSAALKTAGTQSITATDTTTSSLTGSDSGITVKPAAASKFILSAPARVIPGAPFSLTVTVEDAYGNVVVGYTGTIHFSSTDNRARLPANYTFTAADAGVHTFTGLVLHRTGNQKISVTDTHNSALMGSTIVDVL